MAGTSKESISSTSRSVEEEENDVDMAEFDRINKIFDKETGDELKFLEFERQMFLDCIYNDALVICAKGISYERVLLNLFKIYTDPANLVLVLNSDDYEEKYFTKLLNSPHVRQASNNANEREKVYLSGGLQFISTQILVLDLLKNKIPSELITGIIVLRAHQIIESCQEAFVLRLYRQKNKTGFIKAFTNSAEAFTFGYGHVEKVMRNLFVRELFLWPRFHALVQRNLKAFEPISVEFSIPLSMKMTQIQSHLLDLMNISVKELKRLNPTLDLEEVTVENCITKKFQKILQIQLDLVWNQLNAKTKLIITDLKILRSLMFSAIYGDAVSFYAHTRRYRSADYANNNSGWTLNNAADQVFKLSKERVFNSKDEFDPENPPKWKALSEILKVEIPANIKKAMNNEKCDFDKEKPIRILVLCYDAKTCHQLNQYLTQGSERALFWTALKNDISVQKLSSGYKQVNSGGSGNVNDAVTVNKVKLYPADKPAPVIEKEVRIDLKLNERKRKADDSTIVSKELNSEELLEDDESEAPEYIRDSYMLTMSQRINDDVNTSAADFDLTQIDDVLFEAYDEELKEDLNVSDLMEKMQKPTVFIQTFKSDEKRNSSLSQTLNDMQPDYVVLYHVNITAIRQIETFEARLQRKRKLTVFVLMHGKTVEEQSFLTSLRREKRAFEFLIETKRTMVVPEYQDGKTDLTEYEEPEQEEENASTRKAGGQEASEKKEKRRVIVDSREFRSELPCLIHKRGIDVVPAMITIGDYILTPDVCVERKSISDLIGSLNCGRLYNQCQQMTRFYSKAILLIEFDQNRPFHLQGRYMLSRDSEVNSNEIIQKLQLLTIHFPQLKLIWSPSPYATAQLFEELKVDKEEPNLEKITQMDPSEDPLNELTTVSSKYNTAVYDFLLKLPGINEKNVHTIMRKGKSLKNLVKLKESDLAEMLGNSKDAKLLHNILHNAYKPPRLEQKLAFNKKFTKKF